MGYWMHLANAAHGEIHMVKNNPHKILKKTNDAQTIGVTIVLDSKQD